MVPAGYAMTEAEAHTAATSSTASTQQYHVGDSQAPAVQAVESAAAQQAVAESVLNLNSAEDAGQAEATSSSACDILVIEDAAELTHDRAAAILRQLSYECQAAGKHGASPLYANQGATSPLQSPCQAAAASVSAHPHCAHAAVSASVTQLPESDLTTQQDRLSQQPEEEEEDGDGCRHAAQAANASLLHHAGDALDSAADHLLQTQILLSPYEAAGPPASQQLPAQHLAVAARPQNVISNVAPALAESCHQQRQIQQSAAQSAMDSAPAAESPFLQRLRMSKQACSIAPSSSVVQPSSMPGQHL